MPCHWTLASRRGSETMSWNPSGRIGSILPVLKRCLWLGMLAAHGPALVGAWRSFIVDGLATEHLGGCLGLSLAMLFFALKLCGVAELRFPVNRRAWLALTLIVALIHVDCIQPGVNEAGSRRWAVVAAVSILLADPTRVARAVAGLLAKLRSIGNETPTVCRVGRSYWLNFFLPHGRILLLNSGIPRSPPSTSHPRRTTR